MRERQSFCRICQGSCGTRVTLDEHDRILSIRGDRENPMTAGYICFKGINAAEAHNSADRLRGPLKRQLDGGFTPIALEQALDEIAAKLREMLDKDGPESVGLFVGNGAFPNSAVVPMHYDFMRAIKSDNRFTSVTIDQSAKMVSFERLGAWGAGLPHPDHCNVALLFGGNPLVSHAMTGLLEVDPSRRIKRAKAAGFRLAVIDPRRTETARHAEVFLQPYPGQDAAIAAGLLRLILQAGQEDRAFCARWVGAPAMARLRAAVAPFTTALVEHRAGLRPGDLQAVVDLFLADGAWGAAFASTGVTMSPFGNLAHHLIDCLNVVCGRFPPAGTPVLSADMMLPFAPLRAEVIPPGRSWLQARGSRIRGVGTIMGERMTSTLADEILTPGAGQIRCLLVDGGNPASSVPDRQRIVAALGSLDLLVVIDPFMTPTARLAHYVLPPYMQYERSDLPLSLYGSVQYPVPWTAYTPALARPPGGAALVHDWYVFWSLAQRLGVQIVYDAKHPLDMQTPPAADDLLAMRATNPVAALPELKKYPAGKVYSDEPMRYVAPAAADAAGLFGVMPEDVEAELASFLNASLGEKLGFSHLLAVRRMPFVYNSHGLELPNVRKRSAHNPAFLHPDDMRRLDLLPGDRIALTSDHGRVEAIAEPDDTVKPGVVSMSHGWGGLPDDDAGAEAAGTSVNPLISTERDLDTIHVMPRMSAIPVNVAQINPHRQ